MLAFHNDSAVKTKYVDRVHNHMLADRIIRGTGWSDGKGCAVGCTLENYDHSRYPVELGIPEWLARVEDTLFEGMGAEKSRTWPKVFLENINVGADLEKAKAPFILCILKSNLNALNSLKVEDDFPNVKSSVLDSVAVVNQAVKLWSRSDVGSENWKLAAESAWSAAGSAAWSAAESARRAAWSAESARESKYNYFADELITILQSIKPNQEEK